MQRLRVEVKETNEILDEYERLYEITLNRELTKLHLEQEQIIFDLTLCPPLNFGSI